MKIFITGSLGFLLVAICPAPCSKMGNQITGVGRSPRPRAGIDHPSFHYLAADTSKPGDWQAQVAEHDIVINLAGKSIFTYWTETVKKRGVRQPYPHYPPYRGKPGRSERYNFLQHFSRWLLWGTG